MKKIILEYYSNTFNLSLLISCIFGLLIGLPNPILVGIAVLIGIDIYSVLEQYRITKLNVQNTIVDFRNLSNEAIGDIIYIATNNSDTEAFRLIKDQFLVVDNQDIINDINCVFKENDLVFDYFKGGTGIIIKINMDLQWPIIVKFDDGKIGMYLLDGKRFIDDSNPSLSHEQYLLTKYYTRYDH